MKHLFLLLLSFSMVFAYTSSSRSSTSSNRSTSSVSKSVSYTKPAPTPVKATPAPVKSTPESIKSTSSVKAKSLTKTETPVTKTKKKESKKSVFHPYKHRSLMASAPLIDSEHEGIDNSSYTEDNSPDFNLFISQTKKDTYKISSNDVNLQTFKVIVKDSSNRVIPVSKASMTFKTKSKQIKIFASNEKYDEEFSFSLIP